MNPRMKDIFIIPYLPFIAVGFLIGSIIKAILAGVDFADQFSKWGARR